MEKDTQDRQETKECKNEHSNQHIEQDDLGRFWQHCFGCDRRLFVR